MMKVDDLFEKRNDFFLSMSPTWRGGVVLCLLLGLGAFAGGIVLGEVTRTWGSFLFNLMFFFSIALGGVAFGGMQDVVGAVWGRPIKRLHESFGAFVPVATVAIVGFVLCVKFQILDAHKVYQWVADPKILEHFHGKDVWLKLDFMVVRDILSVVVIAGLAHWHVYQGVNRDMAFVRGEKEKAKELGSRAKENQRYWSAPVLVVYALCFSVLCFDLTMSLAPTWFSTLWAGWSFSIMMQTLMAFLLVMMFILKDSKLGHYFNRQQFHDVGKLMHGFTVFFAYLTYAHVLTYWYTNIPEETSYFLTRLERPWVWFILVLPLFNFLLPLFILIPKPSKWVGMITVPTAVMILAAQWCTYMIVVIPELVPGNKWSVPWIELGIFLGFLGMFFLSIFRFASKTPMIALADPLLPKAYEAH